jgi:hypothetical protein
VEDVLASENPGVTAGDAVRFPLLVPKAGLPYPPCVDERFCIAGRCVYEGKQGSSTSKGLGICAWIVGV